MEDVQQYVDEILNKINLEKLQNMINNFDAFQAMGSNAKEILRYILEGNVSIDYQNYFQEIGSFLLKEVQSFLPVIAQIFGIGILSAVVCAAKESIISSSTACIVQAVCASIVAIIVLIDFIPTLSVCTLSMSALRDQIEVVLPILITLTALVGANSSVAVYQPAAVFLTDGVVAFVLKFLFPLIFFVIALNLLSGIGHGLNFTEISKFIKDTLKWLIGGIVAIFGVFLTIQTSVSSLFDGILIKTSKYLVSSSVPIVGGFLSGGFDLMVSATFLVKNAVGFCGILLLLLQVFEPIISLVGRIILLKAVTSALKLVGDNGISSLTQTLSSDVEFLLSGAMMISFMYLLIVMTVIHTAGVMV